MKCAQHNPRDIKKPLQIFERYCDMILVIFVIIVDIYISEFLKMLSFSSSSQILAGTEYSRIV